MNAAGVAEKMSEAIASKKYDFVMCNFANPDMVGHTGKYEPAVIACAATDKGIGQILEACQANGYVMLVTADHGNAEQMFDDKGGPFTAHTNNRVPFTMTGPGKFVTPDHNAALADVAPTVLALMGIPQPEEMTGKSLLAP
jgi:2,3-bisphosphoglycerate-independent phosphoglycerate mutase